MKGSGRKLSRRWECGLPPLFMEAQDLRSAPPGGPSAVGPPPISQLQSGALLSRGPGCRLCEAPGLPPLRQEQNGTPAPADSGTLGLAPQETEGRAGGSPSPGEPAWGETHPSHQPSPRPFIELLKEGGADSRQGAHRSPTTEE